MDSTIFTLGSIARSFLVSVKITVARCDSKAVQINCTSNHDEEELVSDYGQISNIWTKVYHRPAFECVVKQLHIALCKSDCDSNDRKLPSKQTQPSRLNIS